MATTADGSEILTGPQAGELLTAAVTSAGGRLLRWDLDHVDHRPGRSTKALYRTEVHWPQLDGAAAAPRQELFGASAHIGEAEKGLAAADSSLMMTDGDIEVRVWRYPHDPWLPALMQVCYPDILNRTLTRLGIPTGAPPGAPVPLEVLSYRPGRRAVLRADLPGGSVFLKVLQPRKAPDIVDRHLRLGRAGVPVPEVLAHTPDGLLALRELRGRPLAQAVLEEGAAACAGRDLVALLDRFPAAMFELPLRPPWTDSIEFYAGIIATAVPGLRPRLDRVTHAVRSGLTELAGTIGQEPLDVVHGDFYEAQVFVERGRVTGVLDIDTVGPGRRADDLACMLAHLSVLADYGRTGRIPRPLAERVSGAIGEWADAFLERAHRRELALRTAGVLVSLATGPHRQQEPGWQTSTEAMVRTAEEWVERAAR